jgi:uncharacterized protein
MEFRLMKRSSRYKKIENENKQLSLKLGDLKKQLDFSLDNSLGGLVQSAFLQTNLTSFNPILRNNIYAPLTINWMILMYMYKTHGVIQTAIDMPVLDALRGGLELKSNQLGVDELKQIEDELEERGLLESIGEAMTWARLFGGGALIINTNQNPERELNIEAVKKLELYPANRWELMSIWKPGDPTTELTPWEWAAQKDQDYIYFYGEKLHKSRIITLSGKPAPYIIKWQLQGWGMSEVERMVEDFNAYIKTKNVTYDLLEEAKIDVYKFEGFKSQLATEAGTRITRNRVELMNQLKNFNNSIVLDKNDEFEQKQITFAGLAEVMKENRIGIASALRMPMTKLFGLSASGFNSGEDDIENYNAMVESEVRQKLRRPIKTILNLLCAVKYGKVFDIDFEFKPLRMLSAIDEENVKTSKANRYNALYDRMLLDSKEIGEIYQKENLLPIETAAAEGLLDEHPAAPMGIPLGGEDAGAGNIPKKSNKPESEKETV